MAPDEVAAALAPLLGETLRVLAPGIGDARRAGEIRALYYQPRTCELSLGDCFLLAAPLQGDTLCTVDESVLRVAGELGIAAVELA